MGKTQNHPLRAFTAPEEQQLHRIARATSEQLDVVKRALLAVQAFHTLLILEYETGRTGFTGCKSGVSISQLVARFNQRGLSALLIAPGRGLRET